MPIVDVNDRLDFSLPYLRGERLCSGQTRHNAPGAGNYAKESLANPANSTRLLIVDRITFWTDTATDVWLALLNTVPAGTLGRKMNRDARNPGVPVGAVNYALDAVDPGAAPINILRLDEANANSTTTLTDGWVLPPGWSLRVGFGVVATPTVFCNFSWTERVLSELET